jgi:diaminopimelate decarboxylase
LERVLAAGGDPAKTVFAGVGKREAEIRRALEIGIKCFNVEVPQELDRINQLAGDLGTRARVSLRVNPDVDAQTHPYISTGLRKNKFGIDVDEALREYRRAADMPHLDVIGIGCHIGSQLLSLAPFVDAVDRLLVLADQLRADGIDIQQLDVGGGLGIRYRDERPPEPGDYARALSDRLSEVDYEIVMEPGRAIAGNAGVLLTRVEYLKSNRLKRFAIVDAAMNDLIRPSLYEAWQDIVPARQRASGRAETYDIVGPVCETGDFLGKDRLLELQVGDLLAVRSAGAYGFSMSSNYNSRPRPAEVLVDDDKVFLIRRREDVADLCRGELLPD